MLWLYTYLRLYLPRRKCGVVVLHFQVSSAKKTQHFMALLEIDDFKIETLVQMTKVFLQCAQVPPTDLSLKSLNGFEMPHHSWEVGSY
jgi:hypothetical protein